MAVACFMAEGVNVTRVFDPPKKASLRAWYNSATKMIPDAPKFDPQIEASADVSREAIMFAGARWQLVIARQRTLTGR
jgi:hypothetical protein